MVLMNCRSSWIAVQHKKYCFVPQEISQNKKKQKDEKNSITSKNKKIFENNNNNKIKSTTQYLNVNLRSNLSIRSKVPLFKERPCKNLIVSLTKMHQNIEHNAH